jgi:Spy/CpxP family protein refolding chaperone
LTDEQTRMLRRQVNANREAIRLSLERERSAVQALERTLASQPVDEQALQRNLDAVDAARAEMERVRRDQMEGLAHILNPEQRAKFLLFNRRFDARLRELLEEHRGRAPGGRPGTPSDRRP